MSNQPAFPLHNHGAQTLGLHVTGMTLRDYFAAKAMQGFLSNDNCKWHKDGSETSIALLAYDQADAMLKEREA